MAAAQGLLEYLFGDLQPTWGAGAVGQTQTGRRRYKYGSRKRDNAAAGQSVFLDLGEEGVYSVRVTGPIVDFVDLVAPRVGEKLKRIYTRRGTIYGPGIDPVS